MEGINGVFSVNCTVHLRLCILVPIHGSKSVSSGWPWKWRLFQNVAAYWPCYCGVYRIGSIFSKRRIPVIMESVTSRHSTSLHDYFGVFESSQLIMNFVKWVRFWHQSTGFSLHNCDNRFMSVGGKLWKSFLFVVECGLSAGECNWWCSVVCITDMGPWQRNHIIGSYSQFHISSSGGHPSRNKRGMLGCEGYCCHISDRCP